MKLAILSDAHVHAWSEFSVQNDKGVPTRLWHCLSVWQQVRAYCVVNDISLALFGGDLFHKRGVLYTLPYNLVVAELALWKKAGITLLANAGNHDAADRRARIHALQALESAELLSTVDEDGWFNWHVEGDEDIVITAVSYCPDATELRRRTDLALAMREQELPRGLTTVGLFHHGFKGARVGTSLEYVVKEDADANQYAKSFDVMFSGHYHAHQAIGSGANAWYVGSPMEFVRGETSPKGFLVWDTRTKRIEMVPLDLPRFVKLTGEQIADNDFDIDVHVSGNYVDVVFNSLPVKWETLEGVLRNRGALGVRACPTNASKVKKSSRLEIDPTMGDKQLLESYMQHVGVDPSERDELLRVGLQLLEGVTR